MAALVASGVCRFAVNGTYGGHEVVNIIDMIIETTGSTEGRGDACLGQAGVILNEWTDSIMKQLSQEYTALSVSWIDLDSITGTTGERTDTDEQTWPKPGLSTQTPMPGNVAARVNKNTVAARGQRQGRMFLVGVPELWTAADAPNEIQPGTITAMNTDLAAFLGDINQTEAGPGGAVSYSSGMCVTHTKDGVFTNASRVTTLSLDRFTSSQVRRIRRR